MVQFNINVKFTAYFLLIMILASFDIWFDFQHGIPFRHLIFEASVFFVSLVGFNYFLSRTLKSSQNQKEFVAKLEQRVSDREQKLSELDRKLKSFKDAFSQDIERTFSKWRLTKAERQVAALLLKGLSIKEIAAVRKANENTVRSQCTSLYKKSKLANRSQLSSYFFDDLI